MPHYLIQASYTADGAQGLLAEGGTSRVAEATGLIEALGGTVECLYFVWGTDDIIGITEMPDDASAAATSLAVSASGKVGVRMTPLLSPGEIDAAAEKAGELSYRPPGG
ncbi:MAG: GYD domain-containing protein [Actinomycetota bacterium]|nr:GYD domain-containing protein [Acidimicrobiales bacterium]MEC8814366.1 GYD domain-containing protein [Actinomycetota bacterium]MEC8970079.1 GYD domain-containing protein [Actinomycetota bacterium]MEC8982973.1 GYD domain-containing protein [Actinomycetota bacterium]MEC9427043.1 GYD domain-containing protein [Actinomycetota bacterium]|tara:strand:- start:186 stop:512 length:327 start_codon:yes stop_codon:yes gene_type:complete